MTLIFVVFIHAAQ